MGDKTEIQFIIDKVQAETDAATKVLRTEDLAYIRQPEAVALLVEWLFRDDAMHPGESDVGATLYANHALAQLMGMIDGLPVPHYDGSGAYYPEQIEQARAWITKRAQPT
jgi:hypothetical protein